MLSQSGGERRKLNVRGKQNAIGNTKYTPVKLYCVICEMLPQYAMSQYAAYAYLTSLYVSTEACLLSQE